MIRVMEELLRVLVYGFGGALGGYAACLWVNDQHRLTTAILGESRRPMRNRRRLVNSATFQSGVVILVMVALLLTGITWLTAERQNATQDRRDCLTLAQITETLRARTENYREAAVAERQLWRDIRGLLDADPDGKAALSIDAYLDRQDVYVQHLDNNPLPLELPEDC